MSVPIPPSLRRAGITGVRDNLQPGQTVSGFAKELVRLFGKDLLERLECRPATATDSSSACRSTPKSAS